MATTRTDKRCEAEVIIDLTLECGKSNKTIEDMITGFVDIGKVKLPPKGKLLSQLCLPPEEEIKKEKRTSAHISYEGKKSASGKRVRFKHEDIQKENFDEKIRQGQLYKLESIGAAFCKLLAPENVPTYRVYYDEHDCYCPVGIASTIIPHFKSNREDPLKIEDTVVKLLKTDMEVDYQNKLLVNIKDLTTHLHNRLYPPSSLFNVHLVQKVKNIYNAYSSSPTAVKFAEELRNITCSNFSSQIMTEEMLTLLRCRKEYLEEKEPSLYAEETRLLNESIANTEKILELSFFNAANISQLEKMDKMLKTQGIDLLRFDEDKTINSLLTEADFSIQIQVKYFKNYRIVKRQGIARTTRALLKENDDHNKNSSKDGWIFDFDHLLDDLLYHFHSKSSKRFYPKPTAETFKFTERNVLAFPDLPDGEVRYCPAKDTSFSSSVIDAISLVYSITDNFFRPEDTLAYKELQHNRIFNFFKFKTMLKFLLIQQKVYQAVAQLHLSDDEIFQNEEGESKNVLTALMENLAARIKEVVNVLIPMPVFQYFLEHDGDAAVTLIKEELTFYLEKHTKEEYTTIKEMINLEELNQSYNEICVAAGVSEKREVLLEMPPLVEEEKVTEEVLETFSFKKLTFK